MNETRVYVFDAYGTLLDVHAAVAKHATAIGGDAARFSEIWRGKQLEYTWTLSLMQRYEPFWQLTERALDYAFARFPQIDRALRAPLLDAYRNLDAFAEAVDVLKALRAQGARIGVLSNGNRAMLDQAFHSARLHALIDRIVSVDESQVFKTHPHAYQLVLNAFACGRNDVRFVSSNRWDVAGATAFGFDCVWVNRLQQPDEYGDLQPKFVCADLKSLLIFN
jgi:2-haloacid dehalogenase